MAERITDEDYKNMGANWLKEQERKKELNEESNLNKIKENGGNKKCQQQKKY